MHERTLIIWHVRKLKYLAIVGYVSIEKWIGEWWWCLFEDSIKKAGAAEKHIAISNGKYYQGVPAITVSGWQLE